MSTAQDFQRAIATIGLSPPETIVADGSLHRFSSNGQSGDTAGWYMLHDDSAVPAGAFGCWRTGLQSTWSGKLDDDMTPTEREAHKEHIKAMKVQRDADEAARHKDEANKAATRWSAASTTCDHPYLTFKGIQAYGVRQEGDILLIPLRDTAGTLHSLQTITTEGEKRFRGRMKACYHSHGKPAGSIVVCEGYATGASIHEATKEAVAVAFNAGNLGLVATALHKKYPEMRIIVAADDDVHTAGNPGLTKARAAALLVGGTVAVPEFGPDRGDKDSDFNDLHRLSGLDAVSRCIQKAKHCDSKTKTKVMKGASAWPEPTPLPDALPPVQAFDAELMPLALCGWVADIAYRMQCPPDFPAMAALVAISSLIGARAVVRPKARDDWTVVPNLWGMTIGRPGVKKSPALSEALRPLDRLQTTEFDKSKFAHDAWFLDNKVTAMQADANERKAKGLADKDPAAARALLEPIGAPPEPVARRYIVNDATVEKLGELMQQNSWGILSYRDELYGLLTSLDKPGQEGSRAFYLQSYDGNQGYTFDRIGRGTVHIPRVCLAMIGGIQPGRIQEYVRGAVAGGSADDGLLQRFGLAVWPDTTGEFVHVDQWPDTPAKQAAWEVFERLSALQPASDDEPTVWRFSDAAQALFVEWLVPFETEIRGEELHPAMVSHLSKYRKLIPALALVFAMVDTPDSGGVIHEQELLRALAMGEYLRSHAERLYSAAVIPETAAAAALLKKIKTGKLTDREGIVLNSFAPREVVKKGWVGLATGKAVSKAAEMLVDYDWLRPETVHSNDEMGRGRPSDRYLINPVLLTGKGGA